MPSLYARILTQSRGKSTHHTGRERAGGAHTSAEDLLSVHWLRTGLPSGLAFGSDRSYRRRDLGPRPHLPEPGLWAVKWGQSRRSFLRTG